MYFNHRKCKRLLSTLYKIKKEKKWELTDIVYVQLAAKPGFAQVKIHHMLNGIKNIWGSSF